MDLGALSVTQGIGSLVSSAVNLNEARKNRQFQLKLAKNAHQIEVKDLKAAGLNPILSAGGSGASASGGAQAQTTNPLDNLVNNSRTEALLSAEKDKMKYDAQAAKEQVELMKKQIELTKNQAATEITKQALNQDQGFVAAHSAAQIKAATEKIRQDIKIGKFDELTYGTGAKLIPGLIDKLGLGLLFKNSAKHLSKKGKK
ncbi:DNA pilot protein [Microviridae sp.]|nr:DNA pilot protein [Microviridae sp.]